MIRRSRSRGQPPSRDGKAAGDAKPSKASPYNIKERPSNKATKEPTTGQRKRGRPKTSKSPVKKVKAAAAAVKKVKKPSGELPPYKTCQRPAKINRSSFEGLKGTDDENDDAEYLEAQITFTVDQPISLLGIKFTAEIHQNPNCYKDEHDTRHPKNSNKYEEEAFIYLIEGTTKLADSHVDDEIIYDSLIDALFTTPYNCKKDTVYKIKVLCNVDGAYPTAKCADEVVHENVKFKFNVSKPSDSTRECMIRALLYKTL